MKVMKANKSTTINKSVISYLEDQNLVNDSLLVLINNLTLEDLIAIKLELSARHFKNRLYGFDIWRNSSSIIKDALLKFAISTTNSKKDAARFLGMTYGDFKKTLSRYKVDNYFEERENELESI
tara:strand:- start:1098 stop:1469 length:372 start_codon:yes stop_codon:yes gene_type:complete